MSTKPNQTAYPHQLKGYICLLLTAILWGGAFVFQKEVTEHLDAFSFNFIRFTVGSLSLIPVLIIINQLQKKKAAHDTSHADDSILIHKKQHSEWTIGGVAGLFMFMGISLQQVGLSYTTTGKSGFITSLYIIAVPILALVIRQRCTIEVWFGALLAILGTYLLGAGSTTTQTNTANNALNIGDMLTFISAFFWAGQVLWLSLMARYSNVIKISIIQMFGCASLSLVVFFIFAILSQACQNEITQHAMCSPWLSVYHLPTLSDLIAAKWIILYTGVVSAGFAFTLQIYGQQFVPASNAALVMSLEGVFALIGGIIFLNEPLTIFVVLGCLLILVAIFLAQSNNLLRKVKRKPQASAT